MAYNPADYEARRRGYTQQYGATGAMNAYANFLARQRGTRGRQDMLRQYEEAQRLEAFKNQLADMESEKAQTIADAARQLYANRMGMI